nr:hypothetical protein [Tanacetum cinerariifolium]
MLSRISFHVLYGRSFAPAIATVTTVTAAIDADVPADRAHVTPSLFGIGSSSTGRTDSVPGGFSDVSGSDFLIGGIHESAPLKFFVSVSGMDHDQLFTEFNVGAARQISLNDEVRMRAEYNIRKKKLKAVVDEQAELLKRERERERERERNELSVKVTDLSTSIKVREQEVANLDQVTAVKSQNDNLVDQVHELEISSTGLQEKVAAYEDFIGQLEKFQDKKMEEVNEKFDKLCADFVDMALHLKEKFYPKAVKKGMHEGLSAGITHGAEGRKLANVTVYNPSAEVDYLSALHRLQNLMVPIHHSPDQRVVGASALSLSLDVSHSRVKKIRENIAKHVSALRGVFVPLSEPLSAAALEGTEGTFGSTHDTTTTLSMTFVSASTILPISIDDYEVAHADGQGDADVDDETATVENIGLFSDVSNAELNIWSRFFTFLGLLYVTVAVCGLLATVFALFESFLGYFPYTGLAIPLMYI